MHQKKVRKEAKEFARKLSSELVEPTRKLFKGTKPKHFLASLIIEMLEDEVFPFNKVRFKEKAHRFFGQVASLTVGLKARATGKFISDILLYMILCHRNRMERPTYKELKKFRTRVGQLQALADEIARSRVLKYAEVRFDSYEKFKYDCETLCMALDEVHLISAKKKGPKSLEHHLWISELCKAFDKRIEKVPKLQIQPLESHLFEKPNEKGKYKATGVRYTANALNLMNSSLKEKDLRRLKIIIDRNFNFHR